MKFFTNGLIAIGVMIGISLVLVFEFLSDFFGSSITVPSEFIAALLGASIALAGTLFTIWAAKEQREDSLKEKESAVVYSVFLKMQKIVKHFHFLRAHIKDAHRASGRNENRDPCSYIQPHASYPDFVKFTFEEKAAFIKWEKVDLFNAVSEMDGMHNLIIDAVKQYDGIKNEATNILSPELPSTKQTVGSVDRSSPQWAKAKISISQANDLIMKIETLLDEHYPYSVETIKKVVVLVGEKTGRKLEIDFPT